MAAERIAKRVRERDRHGLHMEVLRGLGEMLYLAKNPRYAAELEWRLQVDHDNPQFKPVTHTDCACRRALPICGPATIAELILGPDCQMTVEEGQQLLARLKYESTRVRRIARDELIDEDAHIDEGARIAAR
jgi:hypothetical protein